MSIRICPVTPLQEIVEDSVASHIIAHGIGWRLLRYNQGVGARHVFERRSWVSSPRLVGGRIKREKRQKSEVGGARLRFVEQEAQTVVSNRRRGPALDQSALPCHVRAPASSSREQEFGPYSLILREETPASRSTKEQNPWFSCYASRNSVVRPFELTAH